MIDMTSEFGQRVERRLREEQIIWLVTVDASGTPQPSPVWFYWDGSTVLIFSQPNVPKIKNITAHPRVALHFNATADGEDVVVLLGDARIDPQAPHVHENESYVQKYREGIQGLGMTPEQMGQTYSTAIHVTPTKLRGF